MSTRPGTLFSASLAVSLAAALGTVGCEPPETPSQERIIRIQIEGCKDEPAPVAPPSFAAATGGTAGTVIAAASIPAPAAQTVAAAPADPAPVGPVAAIGRPRREGDRDPAALAARVGLKRQQVLLRLDRKDLSILDLPEQAQGLRQADGYVRDGNHEAALRQLEVVDQELRRVNLTHRMVESRLGRVEKRLKGLRRDLGPDWILYRRRYEEAEKYVLLMNTRIANETLARLERDLDERTGADPLDGTASR